MALGTFCCLVPVDDVAAVQAELASWSASPFARLPGTHFARFVVIGELRRDVSRQPADALAAPSLMFSAFFDGERDAYLVALCDVMGDEAHAVWGHCRGCPGHPAAQGATFRAWLVEHAVAPTAVFEAYSDVSVGEIRDALAFRERFRAFAAEREAARDGLAAFTAFTERAS